MSLKPTPVGTPARTPSPALSSLEHRLKADERGYSNTAFAGKQSQKNQVSLVGVVPRGWVLMLVSY